jgi:outer membrane protein TolC
MRGVWNANVLLLAALSWSLLLEVPLVQARSERETTSGELVQYVGLEGLVQQALQKSAGLQAKKRAYEAARARTISAWLPDDPEIGVDVEGQSNLFDVTARTNNQYMAMQTIPFPTKLVLRGQVALRDAEMAFHAYKEEERDIVWHMEQPYYELFLTKKTLASLEEIRVLLEKLYQAAQARYESNQASQHDLLKVQLEVSRLGIEIFNWREKEHLSEAHLSHILNQPLETRYLVSEEPRSAPLSLSRSDLERLALRARPELKAFEVGIKRAKARRMLATTHWLPDLTGRIEARQFKGEDGIREYDTFLGVTVPVWSLIKGVGGEWKSATREVQGAEALYTEMKNEVLLAVHEAYSKVKSAQNALSTYEHLILPQAKQQVEVAFASYEAGRTDFLTLIDAQRTLKDTQIAYANFQAEYEIGLSNLRLAVGRPLVPSDE